MFAEEAGQMHSIGIFSKGDKEAVSTVAARNGARKDEIAIMIGYASRLPDAELVAATSAVCD